VALGVPLKELQVGPFAQFQNCPDDEISLMELVQQLVSPHVGKAWNKSAVRSQVREFLDIVKRPRPAPEPIPLFLREFPRESYRQDLVNATDLCLVGVSLRSVVRAHLSRLEERLNDSERNLRVLLARPAAAVVKSAALRTSKHAAAGVKRKLAEIGETLETLRGLRKQAPAQVEIRTTDYPLAYGLHAMDPGKPNGVLYLKLYPYRIEEDLKPKLVLRDRADREPFEQELRKLWKEGTLDAG
jgi:hypothetical protein